MVRLLKRGSVFVCFLRSGVVGPALASTWEDLCCSPAVDLPIGFLESICSGKCKISQFMIEYPWPLQRVYTEGGRCAGLDSPGADV